MKVRYVVRPSKPPRPRVMRRLPVRERRSVGAGLRRRGRELRNQPYGVSTLCFKGEDNTVRSAMRGAYRPTESMTLGMRRSSMRGSRESPEATEQVLSSVRLGKVCGRNPSMHATGQSDRPIVPGKPSNKGPQLGRPAKDRRRWWREGALTKGNSIEPNTRRTQRREARHGEL